MRVDEIRGSVAGRLLGLAALLAGCDAGADPSGPEAPAKVEIATPSTFVELGQKLFLTATVQNASGRKLQKVQVSWSSSNPTIAEVADGLVTGRYPGSAWIRASAGGAADSVQLTVEGPPVGEIVVFADTLHLIQGRAGRLFVEVRDPAGKPMAHPLLFNSSAPEVASVNGSGEVQGVALGSASVTVTAGLKSVQVPVRVVTGARYRVTFLGTLGGTTGDYSYAGDINERGEVVGSSPTATGQLHAFLWRKGRLIDLDIGDRRSSAVAVNDSGTVLGYSELGKGGWVWRAGRVTRIQTDSAFTFVQDINNRGQVAGVVRCCMPQRTWFPPQSAFLWENGRITWLARPAHVWDINNPGGVLLNEGIWENGRVIAIPGPDPSASGVYGRALNDRGHVVGSYVVYGTGSTTYRWFVWKRGAEFTLLPEALSSQAIAMNNHGDVLGEMQLVRDGQLLDLRRITASSEWELSKAVAFNDLGQIAAIGVQKGTTKHGALLLTPTQ